MEPDLWKLTETPLPRDLWGRAGLAASAVPLALEAPPARDSARICIEQALVTKTQ
jgi:hypothetical protein